MKLYQMRQCEQCKTSINLNIIDCWIKGSPSTTDNFSDSLILMKHFFQRRYRCDDCLKGIVLGGTYNDHYVVRHIEKYNEEMCRIDNFGFNLLKPYKLN